MTLKCWEIPDIATQQSCRVMMTNAAVPALHLVAVAKGGGSRGRQGEEGRGAASVVTVPLDHKFH